MVGLCTEISHFIRARFLASMASDIPRDDDHDEVDRPPWMEENGGLS